MSSPFGLREGLRVCSCMYYGGIEMLDYSMLEGRSRVLCIQFVVVARFDPSASAYSGFVK